MLLVVLVAPGALAGEAAHADAEVVPGTAAAALTLPGAPAPLTRSTQRDPTQRSNQALARSL